MALLSELRTGLATNLATITGLRTAAIMPDNPNPPIAIIQPDSIAYDDTFGRGMQTYTFTVVVLVGRVVERSAQNAIDAFCASTGASSIKLAIESDKKTHLLEELETKVMDRYGNVHTNSASCLPRIEELGIRIKEIWIKYIQ